MRSIAPPVPRPSVGYGRVAARPDRSGDGGVWLAPGGDGIGAPRELVDDAWSAADRLDLDGLARAAVAGRGDAHVVGLAILGDEGRSVDERLAIATDHLDIARRAGGSASGPQVGTEVGPEIGWWSAVVGWLQRRAGRDA